MIDYQIQPNTRRCAITGRELLPGAKYYSVLREEGDKLVRVDFCPEAWQGPPADAFSFWCGRVAAQDSNKRPRIDDDLLMDCFQRLEGQLSPAQVNFRYVVALLLLRRKRLRLEKSHTRGGEEILQLRCPRTGKDYEVVDPRLTEETLIAVQDEVFRVLGWE